LVKRPIFNQIANKRFKTMKRTRQGNIRKEQESTLKVAKQAENKVLDMRFDVGSLPKDVRVSIYNQMIKKI